MSGTIPEALKRNRQLAMRLGEPIARRGVLQHLFVSDALPRHALQQTEISEAWSQLAQEIRVGNLPELITVYLHIPFCSHRCAYCIYHSQGGAKPALIQAYLDRLIDEVEHHAQLLAGLRISTLYIGGGTPTVLQAAQLSRLLECLDAKLGRKPGGEWAFECNPLTIDDEKAELFSEHGFNRVSFGLQSLDARALSSVNRSYQTPALVKKAFECLQAQRFWINVDLIHGLPDGSEEILESDLRQVLAYEPEQITIYEISPYTPDGLRRSDISPVAGLAERFEGIAEAAGYELASLSTCLALRAKTVAPANRLMREYGLTDIPRPYDDLTVEPASLLGLGPTARSYIYGRMVYVADAYSPTVPFVSDQVLANGRAVDMQEECSRYVVAGLGSSKGLDLGHWPKRFGDQLATMEAKLACLESLGLVRAHEGVFVHATQKPFDRFASELTLVPETMLHAAMAQASGNADSPSGPRPAQNQDKWERIQLESPAASVQVVLTVHLGGQACYHHLGGFAFFVATNEADGDSTLSPAAEQLVHAFRGLFERIIRGARPESITDLRALLFQRGSRLRLRVGTGSSAIMLSVQMV